MAVERTPKKQLSALVLVFLAGAFAVSSCGNPDPGAPPYTAYIFDLASPEFVGPTAQFATTERVLDSIDDLESLRGPELKLVRGGTLEVTEAAGSIIAEGAFKGGTGPDLRFDVEDGVVVPLDYASLAMLSAYHHFSRAIRAVEYLTDKSVEEFVAGEPLEVLFEPQFSAEGVTVTQKLNAFYFHGARRQFGLLQRSEIETITLGVNPLVITHETGHAIFEWLVYGGKAPLCEESQASTNAGNPNFPGRLTVEYAVSGFNEGFADFYAFSLHGASDIFSGLGILDDGERRIDSQDRLDSYLESCDGAFYCLGTLLARSLHQSFLDLGLSPENADDRALFSRQVTTALEGVRSRMHSANLPAPTTNVASCVRTESLDASYDFQVGGVFLAALAAGLPSESQAAFCQNAIFYFGVDGFPVETRGVCNQ